MFSGNRNEMRQFFLQSWQKYTGGQVIQPLEQQVADIIRQHPEYHGLLEQGDAALDKDYLPEAGQTNPFLHMGMHISLQEQLAVDRPPGIVKIHQQLCTKLGDPHEAEHQMMECLGQILWEAQRNRQPPDEAAYLDCLRALIR